MSDWKNVQYKDGKFQTGAGGGGGGSSTFAGLDDVSFSNLQNGQVPKYNSETQKWENADESGGGGTVTDVQVDGTSVVNPQTGVAEITMPTPPTIPVEDVEVNGESVVNAQKVAEIKSYKEVTQAEYNALPDSKLNDGILYAIKDSAGADGFPPLIYSDEEREIGVWRDGKPLYQKTFSTNITSTTQWIMTGLMNVERVITSEGSMINSNNEPRTLPSADSSSIAGINTFIFSNGELACLFRTNNSDMRGDLKVTLRYTKTTDTAGSGTWTTQGGYAHHYSTEEKVIGTWIDGKPIYEIVKPITTTSGNYNFDVSSLNIDFLVDLRIQIKNVNVDTYVNGTYWQATDDYFNYYMNSTKQIIIFRSGAGYSYGTGHVILQYTKSTD